MTAKDLNQTFRALYAAARDGCTSGPPLLILLGDALYVMRGGAVTERVVTPPLAQLVKTVAHTPVAVFVLFRPECEERLRARVAEAAREIRTGIDSLKETIETIPGPLGAKVSAVLDAADPFLARVLHRNACERRELEAFARSLGPALLDLVEAGTAIQLQALHAAVDEELGRMTEDEKANVTAIVAGAHQARARNLGRQYFLKRFGEEPGAERRVVYAEAATDVEAVRELVSTRALDRDIATAFFADPARLQRDVLGDAAAAVLGAFASVDSRP